MPQQPVIKWTGSKRSQAKEIVSRMPDNYNIYYEPFLGGGSVLYKANPKRAICTDICEPLINVWNIIKMSPRKLYASYAADWSLFCKDPSYYYEVRERFNKSKNPYDFFFLTRTCINGKIRFNKKGEFNSAVHHKRNGINPETMKEVLLDWSEKIQNVLFLHVDYKSILHHVRSDDFVYLDPPYFNTKGLYYGGIDYDEFISFLRELCKKNVKYILSYNGVRGNEDKRVDLPKDVYKKHELLLSGNSGFNRLNGEKKPVYESIYLNY